MKKMNKNGFTLLEILVVIVIMALLMGITFRIAKSVKASESLSSDEKNLQKLHTAIAEFHAEYGIYPPVEEMRDSGDGCSQRPGCELDYTMPVKNFTKGFEYKFGLLSFLVNRVKPFEDANSLSKIYEGVQAEELNAVFGEMGHESGWADNSKRSDTIGSAAQIDDKLAPSQKDEAFYKRVYPILFDGSGWVIMEPVKSGGRPFNELMFYKFDVIYITQPPYSSYSLFCPGPDGKVVYDDPLNRNAECPTCGGFHNRDNVYGGVDDN